MPVFATIIPAIYAAQSARIHTNITSSRQNYMNSISSAHTNIPLSRQSHMNSIKRARSSPITAGSYSSRSYYISQTMESKPPSDFSVDESFNPSPNANNSKYNLESQQNITNTKKMAGNSTKNLKDTVQNNTFVPIKKKNNIFTSTRKQNRSTSAPARKKSRSTSIPIRKRTKSQSEIGCCGFC
jgi:hypothetical protein